MPVFKAGRGSSYDPDHGCPKCNVWNPRPELTWLMKSLRTTYGHLGEISITDKMKRSEQIPKGQAKKDKCWNSHSVQQILPDIYSLPSTIFCFCVTYRNGLDNISTFYSHYETKYILQSHDKVSHEKV